MLIAAVTAVDATLGPHTSPESVVIRLVVAGILGAIIGLERQTHGRAAGLRTMMLICVGCCLVMLVSNAFTEVYWAYRVDGNNFLRIDPARLAYSVMGGIGFLGAGAILKNGVNVRGLTTAATIWCVAAIGMAVGIGWYFPSLITTVLVLFALFILDRVEAKLETHWYKTVEVLLPDEPNAIDLFIRKIEKLTAKVLDVSLERRGDGRVKATYSIRLQNRMAIVPFFEAISREPEVQYIQMR
jgi:putative Mg2+ transporter-C (MgtC) family protein